MWRKLLQRPDPIRKANAIRQTIEKIDVLLRHEEIDGVDRVLRRGRRVVIGDRHRGGVVRTDERSDASPSAKRISRLIDAAVL
jgi:hypothetical protein